MDDRYVHLAFPVSSHRRRHLHFGWHPPDEQIFELNLPACADTGNEPSHKRLSQFCDQPMPAVVPAALFITVRPRAWPGLPADGSGASQSDWRCAARERLRSRSRWTAARGNSRRDGRSVDPSLESGGLPGYAPDCINFGRLPMAKGQQHSNREKKKPKQAKKAVTTTPYAAAQANPGAAPPGKKK